MLGGEANRPDPRWAGGGDWATPPTPSGAVPAFQRAADRRPPRGADPEQPQQFHHDIGVTDLDAAAREALGLGDTFRDAGDGVRGRRIYVRPRGPPGSAWSGRRRRGLARFMPVTRRKGVRRSLLAYLVCQPQKGPRARATAAPDGRNVLMRGCLPTALADPG
ncbi:VOC family protein [Streptomyces sp. RPT161]|uniref:VOC family protein n=1 Tax=Streptomyces sp. RPT161 TaxID=3015993 RepID=UPI002FCF34C2